MRLLPQCTLVLSDFQPCSADPELLRPLHHARILESECSLRSDPRDICYVSICRHQQKLFVRARRSLAPPGYIRLPLCPPTQPTIPSNWLSSHCQVRLIPSRSTCRYLESHLPEPLNPFVTRSKQTHTHTHKSWRGTTWTKTRAGRGNWCSCTEGRCRCIRAFKMFSFPSQKRKRCIFQRVWKSAALHRESNLCTLAEARGEGIKNVFFSFSFFKKRRKKYIVLNRLLTKTVPVV